MAEENIKETNAGVKKQGEIEEVADFSDKVKNEMEDSGIDSETVERFKKWSPDQEDTRQDIKKKTVEEASIDEKNIEKESNGIKQDLAEARQQAGKAGKKVKEKDRPEKELKEASKNVSKPFMSSLLKCSRFLEKEIYDKIMLKFNPYYFDSKEVTADLREKRNGKYDMDVNTTDQKFRDNLHSRFGKEN